MCKPAEPAREEVADTPMMPWNTSQGIIGVSATSSRAGSAGFTATFLVTALTGVGSVGLDMIFPNCEVILE